MDGITVDVDIIPGKHYSCPGTIRDVVVAYCYMMNAAATADAVPVRGIVLV